MTRPLKIPGYGNISHKTIVKEDLEGVWNDIVSKVGLEVNINETVASVTKVDEHHFQVVSQHRTYLTQNVILAIGRRGIPRKLGVPGEDDSKVSYSLREPDAYQGDSILVVGGGDSAVEAALALAEQQGNQVTISYRKDAFARIKPLNSERIEKAIREKRVAVRWNSSVTRIDRDSIQLRSGSDAEDTLPNNNVFVFIGGVLPTKFLTDCGIEIDTKFGTK